MYREQIRVLDCTIRDGGLINKHQFSTNFVKDSYQAVSAAGVDYFEIGYLNSAKIFSGDEFGPWKFCEDDIVRRAVEGVENGAKISVMADVGRVDMDAVRPASESPIDMVRTAAYVRDLDKAIAMSNIFADMGYETCINVMAISRDKGPELEEGLHQLEEESLAKVIYIVDSFGSLYQESIASLVRRFKAIIKTKELGIHCHNNQQLAFSNTIEAIIHGVNYLDSTVYGIGRAAGNCTTELLLGFLKNPKFDLRPILQLISDHFIDLRKEIEWGYIIPYAVAGMMNEHPKEAMALRESDKRDEFRDFYEFLQSPGI